jgi:hypothetical protein
MRHGSRDHNLVHVHVSLHDPSYPRRVPVFVAVVVALLVGCSRIGDDRFPKIPDAALPDAIDLTVDAAGPADAPVPADASPDAAPDAG